MEPEEQSSPPQPVVAVLVTHDAPADRFGQVLHALATQDYPNLDVLVVDTGTIDPTERVQAVLPAAKVHRMGDGADRRGGRVGFGAAANVVLDLVSGAEFYVFCHDDAVPGPGVVSALVAAAERSGADLVITPDGPRGPRQQLKAGLVQLAKLGDAPIIIMSFACSRGYRFASWDRFLVPCPFSTGIFCYSPPFFLREGEDLESFRLRIEAGMEDNQRRVARRLEEFGVSAV